MYKYLPVLIMLASIAIIPASYAQNADNNLDEQRWFQIELFVFANTDPGAESAEQWPDDLRLQYPGQLYQLLDQPVADSEAASSDQAETAMLDTADISEPTAINPEQEESPQSDGPTAFLKLSTDQHQLTDIVRRISGRRNYRFLMHESWLQPLQDRDTSIPILIRAGEQFDNNFELEGSVNISVERYLHIYTDLWLSRFVNKDSATEVLWPVLPTPPENILNAPQHTDLSALLVSMEGSGANSGNSSFSSSDLSFEGLDSSAIGNNTAASGVIDTHLMNKALDTGFQSYDSFFDFEQRYFRTERTATLRQHRRMRSNELHYIDHPLMGLLIKIMPYEPPTEPQAIATTKRESP